MKTKAAILIELNTPLAIDDLEIPSLEIGQVLVEVHSSGICGAQIAELSGAKGPDKYLPHLLGHEGAGIVADIGPGVSHVKIGDHVVMHWRKGAGIEAGFPQYQWKDGWEVGAGKITTFQEYSVVSENRVTPIDPRVPFDIAALMGCAVTTAFGLVNNEAQLKIGQSIAVAGCGGVGLAIIMAASMIGAYPIVAVDLDLNKIEQAMSIGADTGVESANILANLDVFVDCTGSPDVIEKGYNSLVSGGRMILVGQPHHKATLCFPEFRKHYYGKTMMDSQGGLTYPPVDIPRYLRLYQAGKTKLDDLITHRFPLDRINQALDVARSGEAGRCMLDIK